MTERFLTKKEMEIMTILWGCDIPVTASQIADLGEELSIYTVQQVLQRLLKANFIEVAGISYSGKALARFYKASVTDIDYIRSILGNEKLLEFAATLVKEDENDEELAELERIIKQRRKELRAQ